MAELYPIDSVLEKLTAFENPIHRMLLATAGTLQSQLSAYFRYPVSINVIHQEVTAHGPPITIQRKTELLTQSLVVCRANTQITTIRDIVERLIMEKKLGLGQIMTYLGVNSKFRLLDVGSDDSSFWRTYKLDGEGICYRISEIFSRELY